MWLDKFIFGIVSEPLQLFRNPANLNWIDIELGETDRNLFGDKKKSIRKIISNITIDIYNCDIDTINQLQSIRNNIYEFKILKCTDRKFKIENEIRISDTTNIIYIANSSRYDIQILGVWLYDDINKEGTNYYLGGTFDFDLKQINLGTPLPSANTKVRIDYVYSGWIGDITEMAIKYTADKPLLADVSISIEGV